MYVTDTGTGHPVLAIHGLGGSAHFFDELPPYLQPRWRTLAIDLPGTGRSSAARMSMESWVTDIGRLAAETSAEPVVLIGHSMGTMIAMHAWRSWPERIRALVLVGGLPKVRPLIRERLSQRLTQLEGAADLRGWGERVAPGVFSPLSMREQPGIVEAFVRRFDEQSVESYVRCLTILLDADTTAIAPTITIPTLTITGEHDQYAPPDLVAEFAHTIPGARFEVLPGCGHVPFLEAPPQFGESVRGFLDRL